MNDKIIFVSALGYWNTALVNLFDVDEKNIVKWDIIFNDFDNLAKCPELKSKNKLETKGGKNPDDHLYVFIAPLTWASRYQECGFKILGPAFGTNDSLSVFAGMYNYDTNRTIKIGTIGKYITSTALFLVYHLFMEHIFDSNIHFISQEGKVSNRKEKINFEFIDNFEDTLDRYEKLRDKNSNIDYAIFTIEDVKELNLNAKESGIRQVLKVDPVLAHIFNIDYVPRTVFCIHESQIDKKDLIKEFHKMIIKNKGNFEKPLSFDDDVTEHKTKTNDNGSSKIIYPIDPENKNTQKIQNLIIKYYRQMLKADLHIENPKTIDKFKEIVFTKINDLEK